MNVSAPTALAGATSPELTHKLAAYLVRDYALFFLKSECYLVAPIVFVTRDASVGDGGAVVGCVAAAAIMVLWYTDGDDFYGIQSEQSSPFRRWTTGSGAGSSYRTDHRSVYNKQMSEGCGGPSGSSGAPAGSRTPKPTEWPPVAGWALGLESLLADPIGVAAFAIFLSKEFAGENIRFWYSCEQYQHTDDTETRIGMAEEIFQRHLAERAPEPVNVDAQAKRAAELNLHQSPLRKDLFLQAQKQIFNVMKFDSYPRFLRSETYGECARAQLCGQKPPFLATALTKYSETFPAPLLKKLQSVAITDPVHPEPSTSSSSSKVKKSSSNASEKRRSGVNLMRWRTGSKDRATVSSCELKEKDVVKASQAAAGQGTLCRLVLPDGATSVVEVDAALTVGRLVDRLLEKRKLKCNAYEVLLKEPRQGEARFVDSSAASSTLGGREVLVERRCLVRLEVRGKCVLVRCRPARRLRHVLRPVLAKYTPDAADAVVWMDGELVSFDTLMEELDGCKMLIAEQRGAGGTLGARARRREPDADSLSDLALRLAEAALSDGDQPSAHRARPPGAGGPEPAGLVRAALHPGPPLHHPPDFLENLRETQRQMLQNSSEPSPTPRTPPPLPPKPARMPTVV